MSSLASVDMMWNNSVELDGVRALIDCKTSNVQVTLDERTFTYKQCSRIRILCFFHISKKHDFLRFFEMTYQKVVKSL